MYKRVDRQATVRENFVRNMVSLGVVSNADADAISAACKKALEDALERVRGGTGEEPKDTDSPIRSLWREFHGGLESEEKAFDTAISNDVVVDLLKRITTEPDIQLNRKLARLLKRRSEMLDGKPLDWWAGEALAFASLLREGTRIRLSGQDSQRGTFSHRHAVLHDQKTGQEVSAFDGVPGGSSLFRVYNSPLSEAAVLAFEFGYSLEWPDGLIIWEAQFGDFANGAQVIIDQFISTSEDKWSRLSGLVLLLPHGFEGQGPEHSSARLERFLTLAAEDNIRVANLTTPAQIFHALRRQIHSKQRKPLVVMTPKSLLRHPQAVSSLDDFTQGGFQKVIAEESEMNPAHAPFVVLCSGKVYYDLLEAREADPDLDQMPILRVEQLYPFPEHDLAEALSAYPEGTEVRWVQEEPANMGAWRFFREHFEEGPFDRFKLVRVCRPESASPATGSGSSHKLEQARLLAGALAKSPRAAK
jgi:2-oxoglutarate dehydrogenase E1 component